MIKGSVIAIIEVHGPDFRVFLEEQNNCRRQRPELRAALNRGDGDELRAQRQDFWIGHFCEGSHHSQAIRSGPHQAEPNCDRVVESDIAERSIWYGKG